jgi:hypothetical protein
MEKDVDRQLVIMAAAPLQIMYAQVDLRILS